MFLVDFFTPCDNELNYPLKNFKSHWFDDIFSARKLILKKRKRFKTEDQQ